MSKQMLKYKHDGCTVTFSHSGPTGRRFRLRLLRHQRPFGPRTGGYPNPPRNPIETTVPHPFQIHAETGHAQFLPNHCQFVKTLGEQTGKQEFWPPWPVDPQLERVEEVPWTVPKKAVERSQRREFGGSECSAGSTADRDYEMLLFGGAWEADECDWQWWVERPALCVLLWEWGSGRRVSRQRRLSE